MQAVESPASVEADIAQPVHGMSFECDGYMNKIPDNAVKYHEVQKFRQKWLAIILAAASLFLIISFGYGMIKQLIFGHPWGDRPMSDTALAIVGPLLILIGIGIPLLFYKMKLLTEVREDGVIINFSPLSRQTVLIENIIGCEVETYRPVREFGGWGVRYGRSCKAYNVSGNRGVRLELSNGKRILIGSRRPEELAQAIQAQMRR